MLKELKEDVNNIDKIPNYLSQKGTPSYIIGYILINKKDSQI